MFSNIFNLFYYLPADVSIRLYLYTVVKYNLFWLFRDFIHVYARCLIWSL